MISRCKDCGGPIDTIRKTNGRLVAVEPKPRVAYSASGLTLTVYLPHKPASCVVPTKAEDPPPNRATRREPEDLGRQGDLADAPATE